MAGVGARPLRRRGQPRQRRRHARRPARRLVPPRPRPRRRPGRPLRGGHPRPPQGVAGAVAVAVAAALAARGAPPALAEIAARTPDGPVRQGLLRAADLPSGTGPEEAAAALGSGRRIRADDTVPFALWCAARHPDDLPAALWTAAAGLGDVDTTCAITGGVVGARTGTAALGQEWTRRRSPCRTGPTPCERAGRCAPARPHPPGTPSTPAPARPTAVLATRGARPRQRHDPRPGSARPAPPPPAARRAPGSARPAAPARAARRSPAGRRRPRSGHRPPRNSRPPTPISRTTSGATPGPPRLSHARNRRAASGPGRTNSGAARARYAAGTPRSTASGRAGPAAPPGPGVHRVPQRQPAPVRVPQQRGPFGPERVQHPVQPGHQVGRPAQRAAAGHAQPGVPGTSTAYARCVRARPAARAYQPAEVVPPPPSSTSGGPSAGPQAVIRVVPNSPSRSSGSTGTGQRARASR
ncbi:ADP-ribosylglycohydrolase family protein [Streptomyces albulus]|nr:ADP-ribosylglycohydrolase family protein [Streptomyces noursei]